MKNYAIISFEFSNFTDRELIRYTWVQDIKGTPIFHNVTVLKPLRNQLNNVFKETYKPFGNIYEFEAEDDDSAKLIFEVGYE